MTVEEVAKYLRLNPQTVYRRAQAGEIPAVRIGRTLRFPKEVLDEWMRITSLRWGARQREELYGWARNFAAERGLSDVDVLKKVTTRRQVEKLVKERRDVIRQLAAQYGAHNVRIFGSVARGEADASSDIDFLVDLEPERSLLDLGGLLMELEQLLGVSVDVVTAQGLRPHIRERVLQEAVPI